MQGEDFLITHRGYTGVILGLYWGYTGLVENKMETKIS